MNRTTKRPGRHFSTKHLKALGIWIVSLIYRLWMSYMNDTEWKMNYKFLDYWKMPYGFMYIISEWKNKFWIYKSRMKNVLQISGLIHKLRMKKYTLNICIDSWIRSHKIHYEHVYRYISPEWKNTLRIYYVYINSKWKMKECIAGLWN